MISVVPALMPVISPDPEIVPTAGVELLHAPIGVALLSVIVSPAHTAPGPVIADGIPFTVTTAVVIQPAADVYVIVDVPTPTAVQRPVAGSIVATDVVPLDHAPPTVELLSVAVWDWHKANVPVIAPGVGSTVNVIVVKQPDGNV